MQPTRKRIERGIYQRLGADGTVLGLEIAYKDGDDHTRRRSVSGGLPNARDTLAAARVRRVNRDAEPLDPRATFNAVCDADEQAHVASLRPNSQVNRRAALARLRDAFGSKRITQIRRTDVRQWVNDLAGERKANTVRSYYGVMRAVFNFAASDLDIPVTFPHLKPSELPNPADDRRERRILTDDELARVLDAAPARSRPFLQTCAETGCRASEALGLTPSSVGDGTIAFTRQLGKDGTQSRRTIEVRRALSAQLRLAGH